MKEGAQLASLKQLSDRIVSSESSMFTLLMHLHIMHKFHLESLTSHSILSAQFLVIIIHLSLFYDTVAMDYFHLDFLSAFHLYKDSQPASIDMCICKSGQKHQANTKTIWTIMSMILNQFMFTSFTNYPPSAKIATPPILCAVFTFLIDPPFPSFIFHFFVFLCRKQNTFLYPLYSIDPIIPYAFLSDLQSQFRTSMDVGGRSVFQKLELSSSQTMFL